MEVAAGAGSNSVIGRDDAMTGALRANAEEGLGGGSKLKAVAAAFGHIVTSVWLVPRRGPRVLGAGDDIEHVLRGQEHGLHV